MSKKTTAIILALILGGFGVQRMYVKQVGLGIVLCLFFWTGVPAIIAIIDIVRWLMMSEEDFNKNYVK